MSHTPLDDRERKLISRLLRMRRACSDFNQMEMVRYLKEKYDIIVPVSKKRTTSPQLSKLEKGETAEVFKGSGMDKRAYIENWRRFIEEERVLLGSEVSGGGSFNVPYKFNYESAIRLSRAAKGAEMCLFFNTYINLNEWHNALVQMHLCIQKSIEQKNNFLPICKCHDLKAAPIDKRKGAIDDCSKNPPSYNHYRILFLPYTNKEFNQILQEKLEGLSENFRFSTLMHCMLSIQLAVLTVTDLAKIMVNHPNFFKHKENLKRLGFSIELFDLFDKFEQLETQLQKDIQSMGEIPEQGINEGIDFVYLNKKEATDTQDLFWSAFYDKEDKGLTYYPINLAEFSLAKKIFAEIIFDEITEKEQSAIAYDILEFDPLHDLFYNANKSLSFFRLTPKFDSLHRTGLMHESFH